MTYDLTGAHDLDTHEMIPTNLWGEHFGAVGAMLAPLIDAMMDGLGELADVNNLHRDDITDDEGEITHDVVWNVKGPDAPGATRMERRTEVMDLMGVNRQLIFPGFGQSALASLPYMLVMAANDEGWRDALKESTGVDASSFDPKAIAGEALRAHNDWALATAQIDERLRPVAMLPATESLDVLMAEAHRMIDGGVRSLWLPAGVPPCGKSPADEAMDPLWSSAADADVSVVLHVGGEFDFLKVGTWREARPLQLGYFRSPELPGLVDIYSMSTIRLSVENYLTTLVLGGVFERHPRLRFGAIEVGASWVGPLMDSLDMWAGVFPTMSRELSLRPSEYFARNVRVTPFPFEPIDEFIDRYPAVVDVLAYSSDYPHVEGGRHSKRRFHDRIAHFGDDVVEKFFTTNGELLVPA